MTLGDLAGAADMTQASLSRSENALRDIEFAEIVAIADVVKIDVEAIRSLAETFERAGTASKSKSRSKLTEDLNELQRLAIEAAVEVRNLG